MGGRGRSVGGHRGSWEVSEGSQKGQWDVKGGSWVVIGRSLKGGRHYDKKTTRQLGLEPVSSKHTF